MNSEAENNKKEITEQIRKKAVRRQRHKDKDSSGLLFGLGMFGLVGWSVSIPAVTGLALGIWIDSLYKSRFSWTLMLLTAGIITGCLNAWYWVVRERDEI